MENDRTLTIVCWYMCQIYQNTNLVEQGALAHRLQHLQNVKWPLGGPKTADRVWKSVNPLVFVRSCQLSLKKFLIQALLL